MAKGFYTGGRKPLSATAKGRAPLRAFRLPAELNGDLDATAKATGKTASVIVRDGIAREVARLKRQIEKRGGK